MHKKHAELQKPTLGKFGRHEVALLGTSCEKISEWAALLKKVLAPAHVVYADANHHPSHANEFSARWTDHQHAVTTDFIGSSEIINRHLALSQTDAIIVNGNHFEASHQIIFCDPDKEASLRKRASQLTHVIAIITTQRCPDVSQAVKEIIPNWASIPLLNEQSIIDLAAIVQQQIMPAPSIKALIMAGGKSVRMGKDKTQIAYHGKPQVAHLYALCESMQLTPHLSCRAEQVDFFNANGFRTITDRVNDLGPLGGITSAFMKEPDTAWLVIASDVPFVDEELLNELIQQRAPYQTGTSFQSPFDKFPEPLIAIWEPKAYPMILSFIGLGYACPRKVLIQTGAHMIQPMAPEKLENVNTPDDLQDAMQALGNT